MEQRSSSAQQQAASSSLQQQAVSSAQQQAASSALEQRFSSAQQQRDSSAQAELAEHISRKNSIKSQIQELQPEIISSAASVYDASNPNTSESSISALQQNLSALQEKRDNLISAAKSIFLLNPLYQDPEFQTIIPDSSLNGSGVTKVFDSLRNEYIFINDNNAIVPPPITPANRSYTSSSTPTSGPMRGGRFKVNRSRKSRTLFYS